MTNTAKRLTENQTAALCELALGSLAISNTTRYALVRLGLVEWTPAGYQLTQAGREEYLKA